MSEPRFIRLDDFLDFRIQLLNNPINPKSWESFNPVPIPVQTFVEKVIEQINKELAA